MAAKAIMLLTVCSLLLAAHGQAPEPAPPKGPAPKEEPATTATTAAAEPPATEPAATEPASTSQPKPVNGTTAPPTTTPRPQANNNNDNNSNSNTSAQNGGATPEVYRGDCLILDSKGGKIDQSPKPCTECRWQGLTSPEAAKVVFANSTFDRKSLPTMSCPGDNKNGTSTGDAGLCVVMAKDRIFNVQTTPCAGCAQFVATSSEATAMVFEGQEVGKAEAASHCGGGKAAGTAGAKASNTDNKGDAEKKPAAAAAPTAGPAATKPVAAGNGTDANP